MAPAVGLHPDAELLLLCSRTSPDGARAALIRELLDRAPNWDHVLRQAWAHGVVPLLAANVHEVYPEAIPEATNRLLRDHCRANALRNLFLTEELLHLLQLFDSHQVHAIPFKGPVLAVSAYGNLALRQFCDLDILVPPEALAEAKRVLASQGYRWIPKDGMSETAERQFGYNHAFRRADLLVELHWGIAPRYFRFAVDPRFLWQRVEPVCLSGRTVPNVAAEELLLILCIHGLKDCWRRLMWICDLAELIRAYPGMDWFRIRDAAERLAILRVLRVGLLLADAVLGPIVPPGAIQLMGSDLMAESLARQVCEPFYRAEGARLMEAEKDLLVLKARERLRDRLHYCRYRATLPKAADRRLLPGLARCAIRIGIMLSPNERDWSWVPLPRVLVGLYYLLRPVRLLGKHGLGVVKRLWRRWAPRQRIPGGSATLHPSDAVAANTSDA
jgi:hypothetical protein